MGKGSSSAPAAPDPAETAKAQGAVNKETALAQGALNRLNQVTPYGNVTYKETGYDTTAKTPTYTQTTSLSPEQQKLFDINQALNLQMGNTAQSQLNRLQTSLSQPISYDNAPALMSGADQATQAKAEQALLSRINPQLDQDRQKLEARLAAQGLSLNSEAYDKAMDSYNRQANDARMQATLQGINYGMSSAQMQNAARQQSIQEAASIRNQPLNEISALMSGTQVQLPQFSTVPQVSMQTPDYQGAANLQYQGQLANWNAQQQSNNAMMGGLFGLGGSVASALPWAAWLSDKRLKKDIKKIGKWKGFNLYRFKYLWEDVLRIGVMAQEVKKSRPDAIVNIGDFMAVNYGVL